MTAPTRIRRSPAPNPVREGKRTNTTIDAPESKPTRRRSTPARGRPTAAERAYARRAQRAELLRDDPRAKPQGAKQVTRFRLRWPRSRASFVLVMMSLLAAGVATTLWLSTQAIADSYHLENLRQANATLAERSERLQRDVAEQESASSLARKAKELGMVPGGDPARLVLNPDGSTKVVGEPKKATAAPAPPPAMAPIRPVSPTTPPPEQPAGQTSGQTSGQPAANQQQPVEGGTPTETEQQTTSEPQIPAIQQQAPAGPALGGQ